LDFGFGSIIQNLVKLLVLLGFFRWLL
jgi:hypothetical protein